MRYKYSVAVLLFVAVLGMVLLSAPATAAKGDDSVSYAGPNGYVITFYKVPSKNLAPVTNGMMTTMSADSISQGQYQYRGTTINYYTTYLNFYLYWGNPSNSLRLRIVTPDNAILGPFYDPYDGSYNGAVGVTVSRTGGIAQGWWQAEIYGYSVSGTQSFSMSYST